MRLKKWLPFFIAIYFSTFAMADIFVETAMTSLNSADKSHNQMDRTWQNSLTSNIIISHPFNHQHECPDDQSKSCHQCHFGHCGFQLIPPPVVRLKIKAQNYALITQYPFVQATDSLFRPPIA